MVDECCFYLGSRFFDYYACVYTILLRACLPPFFRPLLLKNLSVPFITYQVASERQPLFFGVKRERSSLFGRVSFSLFSLFSWLLLSCCLSGLLFSVSIQYTVFNPCLSALFGYYMYVEKCTELLESNQSINQPINFYYTLKNDSVYV